MHKFDVHKKPRSMGDTVLLQLLKRKDNRAFSMLFDLYYPRLLCFAGSYVKKEDAEEVVHDVFLKLHEKKSLVVKKSLSSLLFTMTRNACLDHLRKRKYNLYLDDPFSCLENELQVATLQDDVSMMIIEEELNEQIAKAIANLPEKCRNVFVKSRFHGYKNREISQECNISIKTVENQMTKALKLMRAYLKDFL